MLLAIDTSTSRRGSIALADARGAIVAYKTIDQGALAPSVSELLPDPKIIEHYAVTIGPGSFTGLRIALAFIKGMALVHPRPVVPISTLAVLARALLDAHPDADLALPMLDARRNEAYAALYTRDLTLDPALEEAAHPVASISARVKDKGELRIIAGGDGLTLDHGPHTPWLEASRELWVPDARVLAAIAQSRKQEGVDAADLEPAYLQLAPAEVPPASKDAKK